MAPPLLGRRDAQGRPPKKAFGPWMKPALALLARCKGLRGTALDPFGHTEERRQERALIQRYRQAIHDLLPRLASCDMEHVLALARLPEAVRGFGQVKAHSIAEMETRWQHLVARLAVEVQ